MAEKRKAYRSAVESRLLVEIADPAEEAAARSVLGSERFVDRMSGGFNDLKENLDVHGRDDPASGMPSDEGPGSAGRQSGSLEE